MLSSIISHEQSAELLEDNEILHKYESTASTTYFLIFQGQEAVLINTAIENYFVTTGS